MEQFFFIKWYVVNVLTLFEGENLYIFLLQSGILLGSLHYDLKVFVGRE